MRRFSENTGKFARGFPSVFPLHIVPKGVLDEI